MEKQNSLGAAGCLNGESPGGATRGVRGGIRGVEAGARPPSGVVLCHGSGHPPHSGGVVIHSPGSSRSSGGAAILGSGPNQYPGEVAGHSHVSGTYAGGFNPPFPGTTVSGTSSLGSGGSGVCHSGSSSRPGSTFLHPHKPCEDRPRGILKNCSSILMQKSPSVEKKKSQRWDEMNILATYHPADKDYGFMKVDEPSTPYHRLQDNSEDLLEGSSHTVTPEELAERFATMDNFCPKVLQYSDNRSLGSSDNFSKTYSSDFEKRRKTHYNEGKFLKTQKNLPLDNKKNSNGGSVSMGSGSRGVMLNPEPRPVERSWAGGLARGVKVETDLVTRNHILEAKDPPTLRNQFPAPVTIMLEQEIDLQRKEYYSKGRYLRRSPHPELEEDPEVEQEDGSTSLNWMIENPISTEVRLLDHIGSPFQDPKATENSLTVTPSQPDATLQLQWTQEEEARQWKM
nr:uncharacterized protein LOC106844188 isoform X2 [Equus asinus]